MRNRDNAPGIPGVPGVRRSSRESISAKEQKARERRFVEQAAVRLDEPWIVEESESPDFIVVSGDTRFGLEVRDVFVGQTDKRGSKLKRNEGNRGNWLKALLIEYESRVGVALDLKYRGICSDASWASTLDRLLTEHFELRPRLHTIEARVVGGEFWATKALRHRCTFLDDSLGWVSRDTSILQDIIREKAANLKIYRTVCPDVRLLLVADRTLNSGKLKAMSDIVVDACGFDRIYFYSYPDQIVVCGHTSNP